MLYLAIAQHRKQLTVIIRNEEGVVQLKGLSFADEFPRAATTASTS